MKAKASKLSLGSSLYSLMFLVYFACADEENCCSFPTDCSDMFRGTGISLECLQEDGGRPSERVPNMENYTPGYIDFVKVEILYQVKCPPQFINEESHCDRSTNLNYIGLNVKFRFTGGSVGGVQFNLQTVAGEVKPIVGTLKNSCHNLTFSAELTADMAGDRLFSYTGYVGLHPGSQYNLTARTFNNDHSSQLVVNIPHCRNMVDWENRELCEVNSAECNNFGKWYDDFFCSIPSPAQFTSKVSIWQDLLTEFTVWPENPSFTSYVLILCERNRECLLGREHELDSAIVTSIDGQETLRHQFSVNLHAGNYSVHVYGQPDEICEADQHWGSQMCPSTICPLELQKDVNHCEDPLFCQADHTKCIVSDKGHASCDCIDGFAFSETNGLCEDINECETDFSLCGKNGDCINTIGDAYCSCTSGYEFDREEFICKDINECETNSSLCGGNGHCINTNGDAYCICFEDYKFNRERFTCEDINECETASNSCGGNGHCINTEGSAHCNCSKGYKFNREEFTCEDINECQIDSSLCGGNGYCNNTEGSVYCNCFKGYKFNSEKITCEDINECEINSSLCGGNGHCVNREGDAYCNCSKGYKFSRKEFTCEDINECETASNSCGGNGNCINTEGSAHCNCFEGYMFNREKSTCEAQMQPWMMLSIVISVTVAGVAIICSIILIVIRYCYVYNNAETRSEMQTVTSDSQLAQFIPKTLLRPPIMESIEAGSEEPLVVSNHLRSM